jgi:hypothetical protein
VQQVGVAFGADVVAVLAVRLDPQHQDGAAAPAQGAVHLVGESGAGEQAGGGVGLGDRGLHGLAAPGQPGDLAAGAFPGGHVADRAADAVRRAAGVAHGLDAAVDVEPAAVGADQPDGRGDRLAAGPGAGDRAERPGLVVAVHVAGEDLAADVVGGWAAAEHRAEFFGPDDLVAGGDVGEPGLGGAGLAGGGIVHRARTRSAFVGCRHMRSAPSHLVIPLPHTYYDPSRYGVTMDAAAKVLADHPTKPGTAAYRPNGDRK